MIIETRRRIGFLVFFCFSIVYGQQLPTNYVEVNRYILEKKYTEAEELLQKASHNKNSLKDIRYHAASASLYSHKKVYRKAIEHVEQCRVLAETSKKNIDQAYYTYALALTAVHGDNLRNALKSANESLLYLKESPEEHLLYVQVYKVIGEVYKKGSSFSEDYRYSAFKSLAHAQKSGYKWLEFISLQDVAGMYMVENNLTSNKAARANILAYIEKAMSFIKQNKNQINNLQSEVILMNNFASMINDEEYKNFTPAQRYQLAEKYILEAMDLVKNNPYNDNFAIVYSTYAEILLNMKKYEEAEHYFHKSYDLIKSGNMTSKYRALTFIAEKLANLYQSKGELEKTIHYKDDMIKFLDISKSEIIADKNKFIEAYYTSNEKMQKDQNLEKESLLLSRQRNFFVALVLFALLLIWFLIHRSRSKSIIAQHKNALLSQEKHEAELELSLQLEEKARLEAEQKLLALQQEQISKQALATSLQLEQKNNLFNEIVAKIKNNESISWDKVLRENRLQDDDFTDIQRTIQEVHPNFYKKLQSHSANKLTSLDLKYAAYISLHLDNQQIANILNVELATVRVTKYRLKQKLGLGKDDDLLSFISTVNTL